MSDDPIGDWYARRAQEARALAEDIRSLKLDISLQAGRGFDTTALRRELEKLERKLEQARYVGD